ncbi:MAG: DUF494 family protein [Candidatus Kapabacteria bacterium]|nr:DUF494 family protein [Ignavibacteriota bacterium]MCW5886149.1 DUF494 family protein [Candidatus Kapabacteria bacterium]
MAERIMEIIIYVMSSIRDQKRFSDSNIKELEKLGYTTSEISTAFSWIAEKTDSVKIPDAGPYLVETKGFRVLLDHETDIFTKEALADLVQYQTLGLMNNEQLEMLIDRVLLTGLPVIDRYLLRSFIAALNFDNSPSSNYPGRIMLEGNDTIN